MTCRGKTEKTLVIVETFHGITIMQAVVVDMVMAH